MSKRDIILQNVMKNIPRAIKGVLDKKTKSTDNKSIKITDKQQKELLKGLSVALKDTKIDDIVEIINLYLNMGIELESACNYLDKKTTNDKEEQDRVVLEKVFKKINPQILTKIKNKVDRLSRYFLEGSTICNRLAEGYYRFEAFEDNIQKISEGEQSTLNSYSALALGYGESVLNTLICMSRELNFVNWPKKCTDIVASSMLVIYKFVIFKDLDAKNFTKDYIKADETANEDKCKKLVRKQEFDILQFATKVLEKLKEYEKTLNRYKLK